MVTMTPFIFGESSYDTSEVFYARLSGEIYKVEQLFDALYYLLWFPGYFGFNWDALNDCLCDLNWIEEKVVVLVHKGLPKLPEKDLKIYLNVLFTTVKHWHANKFHQLVVVFDETDRQKVIELLN